jgi:hypothetical protein
MANEWILDVLADLKTFARNNGLPAVAHGLDDLSVVAAAEIASTEGDAPRAAHVEAGYAGHVLRAHGSGGDPR